MNALLFRQGGSGIGDTVGDHRMAPILPMLVAQTRAQARAFWRLPSLSLTALLMPLMLFVFFALPHAHEPLEGRVTLGAYMLASLGAYAVSSVMVFNFGVTLALDRGQKVDLQMRASPLPGWIFMLARAISALAYGVVTLVLLFAVARIAGGISLEPATWLLLGARLLGGAVPFIALGFALAYLTGPTTAPALANLVFIGMAFASGMLVPLDQLPDFLRTVAPFLPTYHYAQFAWDAIGVAQQSPATSAAWLCAFSAGLFGLAGFAYRREARQRFG